MGSWLGGKASVSAVYGDPIEADGVTIVPVARVSFGFGVGAGRGRHDSRTDEGGGGGGGAAAVPIGYIEIKDGTAVFKRIFNPVLDAAVPAAVAVVAAAARPVLRRMFAARR